MKKLTTLALSAAACSSIVAAPVVSDVTMSQDASRTVTINYTLSGEPGIVTVDVQTNSGGNAWVSIGGQHLVYFAGDVNKRVETGARTITWKPRKAWPDNKVTENVRAVLSAWALNAPPDYMVTSLTAEKSVRFYASAETVPFGVTNEMYKTEYLVMRKVPAANVEWRMGSPTTENGRDAATETPHLVTLGADYYIGVYPVTQRQYELLMKTRPSHFYNDRAMRPVEKVSYEDIRGAGTGYVWPTDDHNVSDSSLIGVLRTLTGVNGFDLPTEAQWEFACRAGCGAALYNGQELDSVTTSANLNPLGRYARNGGRIGGSKDPLADCSADNGTAKVGSYAPNAWGLYDMLGNVHEWCLDWFQELPTGYDVATGPDSGTYRVLRGGRWWGDAGVCRCASRAAREPSGRHNTAGLRVACPAEMH